MILSTKTTDVLHFNFIVDLLPIGALTAGGGNVPHSFRPWEVKSIDSIDLMDSCLGSLRFQVRSGVIRRVLPRNDDSINAEWATDKGRYSPLDGVNIQEIRSAFFNVGNGSRQAISIKTAMEYLMKYKGQGRIVYGATTDCESINAMSKWCRLNNVQLQTVSPTFHSIDSTKHKSFNPSFNESFLPESSELQNALLIGCDPRIQRPLLNLQLRQRYLEGTEFFNIGPSLDLTYPVQHCGFGLSSIKRLADTKLFPKFDFVLIGADLYRRKDINNILSSISLISNKNVRVCTTRANESFIRNHPETKPFDSTSKFDFQILVNLTENEVDAAGLNINLISSSSTSNIFINCKGSEWMKSARLIIPVLNSLETQSTYVSMLGNVRTRQIILNRSDSVLSISQLFNDRSVHNIMPNHNIPVTSNFNSTPSSDNSDNSGLSVLNTSTPFVVPMVDYHLEGHTFAESSATMARCSAVFSTHRSNFK